MVMYPCAAVDEAVALQERVVGAIRDNARDLSRRLEGAVDAQRAVPLLYKLAERVDAWREERAVLCRMYLARQVLPRLWRVRPRHRLAARELDLDAAVCVQHAVKWLLPPNLASTQRGRAIELSVHYTLAQG